MPSPPLLVGLEKVQIKQLLLNHPVWALLLSQCLPPGEARAFSGLKCAQIRSTKFVCAVTHSSSPSSVGCVKELRACVRVRMCNHSWLYVGVSHCNCALSMCNPTWLYVDVPCVQVRVAKQMFHHPRAHTRMLMQMWDKSGGCCTAQNMMANLSTLFWGGSQSPLDQPSS